MEPSLKIRRSEAYSIAGLLVFIASMFLPMPTARWFIGTWRLIASLAGAAAFFNARECKAGARTSVGFFAYATLVVIVGILAVLMVVL